MSRVPYNKLLTNLAFSSCTGGYWPSVVFARTLRCSVRTVTTLGQYSPVWPSRSVSNRLIFYTTFITFSLFCYFGRVHSGKVKYSAAQIYPNYAYAYCTLVFWVYAYVYTRVRVCQFNTRVYVPLLCIHLSFFT